MDAPPCRLYTGSPPVKRLTLLLPLLVALCVLVGILLEARRSDDELPSFTPARPPEFGALAAPVGSVELEGRILGPEGAPVADASVYLRSAGAPAWTYTDRDGAFRLTGLQPEPALAVVLAWGFPPTEFEAQPGPEAALWTMPPRSDVVPGLPKIERADLLGRVLHPLGLEQAFEVALLPANDPSLLQGPVAVRTVTDSDGRFHFDQLAVGEYRTLILPAWAAGGSWPNLARAADGSPGATLYHGPDAEPVDLELAAGALEGRLRDPSGLPIEGALVLLSRAEDPDRIWPPALSDPAGGFRIEDLPPGDFLLEVRAGQGVLGGIPVRIEAGRRLTLPVTTLRIREDRTGPGGG